MAKAGVGYVLVMAIDFGTAFSGYSMSFADDAGNIITNANWEGGGCQMLKTPTSVLVDMEGNFIDFGVSAEDRYQAAVEKNRADCKLSLFRHFKMNLHCKESLTLKTMMTSVNDVSFPAVDIFAHALNYMNKHMLEQLRKMVDKPPDTSKIRYVITVPAIYGDQAKRFMRLSAFIAGLIKDVESPSLLIALEPEAASYYCRTLDVNAFAVRDTESPKFPPGTKYVLVDAGGGTIDISAHHIDVSGLIREIHYASGRAVGGTSVDKNFEELMSKLLGASFLKKYREECPQAWLQMQMNFERKKKALNLDTSSVIHLEISTNLVKRYKDIRKSNLIDDLSKRCPQYGLGFEKNVLIIKHETAKRLFDPVIEEIVSALSDVLSKPALMGCNYVMMVGGLSESKLVQQRVKTYVQNNYANCTVLIPHDAQMAVVKGAVLFGHRPLEITARIAKRTYLYEMLVPFEKGKHDPKYRSYYDRKAYSNQLFPIVKTGEEIPIGTHHPLELQPVQKKQKRMCVEFYSCEGQPNDPQYLDDNVQILPSSVSVDMPKLKGGTNRTVTGKIDISGTEIKIELEDMTSGNKGHGGIDLMKE